MSNVLWINQPCDICKLDDMGFMSLFLSIPDMDEAWTHLGQCFQCETRFNDILDSSIPTDAPTPKFAQQVNKLVSAAIARK